MDNRLFGNGRKLVNTLLNIDIPRCLYIKDERVTKLKTRDNYFRRRIKGEHKIRYGVIRQLVCRV